MSSLLVEGGGERNSLRWVNCRNSGGDTHRVIFIICVCTGGVGGCNRGGLWCYNSGGWRDEVR